MCKKKNAKIKENVRKCRIGSRMEKINKSVQIQCASLKFPLPLLDLYRFGADRDDSHAGLLGLWQLCFSCTRSELRHLSSTGGSHVSVYTLLWCVSIEILLLYELWRGWWWKVIIVSLPFRKLNIANSSGNL